MYLKSFDYFRAVAIFIIVSSHCNPVYDFSHESLLGSTIFNLTKGGTTLFVFISGFLFHHVFYKNFDYKNFIVKKTGYVLVPYLIMSVLPIIAIVHRSAGAEWTVFNYITSILDLYVTGTHLIAYWYIPFIMLIFLASPLFIYFLKLSIRNQVIIALALLVVSVLIHRPLESTVMVLQEFQYFVPVYLIGIVFSQQKDYLYSKLAGKEFYILGLVIFLAFIQAYLGFDGNSRKNPFVYGGIDLLIVQKIVLCVFLWSWLHRFEQKNMDYMRMVAYNSFGIFFIHGYYIYFFYKFKDHYTFLPQGSVLVYFGIVILIFILSLITTVIIKKVLPNHSRYLIGS